MSTYNSNGKLVAHYNQQRGEAFDSKGKELAKRFFSIRDGIVEDNDKDEDGNHDFTKTDLKVYFPHLNKTIFVEAEVKSAKNWEYIEEGVDIPIRKIKYAEQHEHDGYFFMVKDPPDEVLLIPMSAFMKAIKDCGDEYLGKGAVPTTLNFELPNHGCHRVRKACNTVNRRGVEDFVRIPLNHIKRYYNPFSVNDSNQSKA